MAAAVALNPAGWDWGGGDFESVLKAAGHVGNSEIALFLIAHGARPNIFQSAVLGVPEFGSIYPVCSSLPNDGQRAARKSR